MVETLNPSQEKAVGLMIDGELSMKQIATECGVSYQTIRVWRMKPEFIQELATRRREACSEAQQRLMAKANHAADRLIAMMDDPEAGRVSFQAAKVVLEMALQSGFIEFEERLLALEEALQERQV